MNEAIRKFGELIKDRGWVFYVPSPAWGAYNDKLFGTIRVRVHSCFLPGEFNKYSRRRWISESNDEWKKEEFQQLENLPSPDFLDQAEWPQMLEHCGLSGEGEEYFPYEGMVYKLEFVDIDFSHGSFSSASKLWEWQSEHDEQKQKTIQRYGSQWMRAPWHDPSLIVRVKSYNLDEIKKTRRRVEDKLRKGNLTDILRMAKFLGMFKEEEE